MKKIFILGCSAAAAKIIETVRAVDQTSEIFLLTFEECLPYQRHLFPQFVSKNCTNEEILIQPRSFYERQRVNLILNKKISRIDFRKNLIVVEKDEPFNYDALVITETGEYKFPDIKGANKLGVFGIKTFTEVNQITNRLSLVDTVVIRSSAWSGIKMAGAFQQRGKEVVLVVPADHRALAQLEPQGLGMILRALEEKGIRVYQENDLVEILGDGEVKAVRLKSKKVIATEMVIFDQTKVNLKLFADTPLKINEKICVDHSFKTNLPNVYAVDEVCELSEVQRGNFDIDGTEFMQQGVRAGNSLLGQEQLASEENISLREVRINDVSIQFIGQTIDQGLLRKYVQRDPLASVYKKFFIKEESLAGAILINVPQSEQEQIKEWIEKKAKVAELGHILGEQNSPSVENTSV